MSDKVYDAIIVVWLMALTVAVIRKARTGPIGYTGIAGEPGPPGPPGPMGMMPPEEDIERVVRKVIFHE